MSKGAIVVAMLALMSTACRHDMQSQPKYTPLAVSQFYPDGRSARPVPADTVAIDEIDSDPALDTGRVNGQFVTSIPVPVTMDLLAKGRQNYDIFCSPCHGLNGYGNGMIATRGFENPANLDGQRVRNAPPGYIYQVIVNGYGAMGNFDYQIKSSQDRWAIVAYIRALELSHGATLDDIPPEERARLEAHP